MNLGAKPSTRAAQGLLPRLPAYYEKIQCPVLTLWGERERHFPLAHAERLQKLVPPSELVVVSSGEHWMAWQSAADVAESVRRFLDRPAQTIP